MTLLAKHITAFMTKGNQVLFVLRYTCALISAARLLSLRSSHPAAWHTFTKSFRSLDGVGGTKVDPTRVMNCGMC
ncbi:hypothetical protein GHK33_03535 [Sinorhizobium meliloti]|uniref:hypothetical protein n=1 Tax=Rhizobium meliloti TaxID=382 RepID=UPI0012960E31|nr:hypothetical protein [Sinorhizobium meliloti]MQW61789.1 hypothetical protein [Sinorhizobium meliloti]